MHSTGKVSARNPGGICIPAGCGLWTEGAWLAAPAQRARGWMGRLSRSAPFHTYYLEANRKPWSSIPGVK